MYIKAKFLELTSKTYPHGTEEQLTPLLDERLQRDEHGNLFIRIGESRCLFTSHLDTASREQTDVKHVQRGNFVRTDGKTILGADDKAGVTVMLYMIEKGVPGLYYFFIGEERGCVGSRKSAKQHAAKPAEIDKVISFDRRGTDSVITHQSGIRCCSEAFAEQLANQLNAHEPCFTYRKDNTGVLTDSLEFVEIYSECTNISVGYYSEHTTDEQQDILHLERLCSACTKIDWESLPASRRPTKESSYTEHEFHYVPFKNKTFECWSTDTYGNTCSFVTDMHGKVLKARLTDERHSFEQTLISQFLYSIRLEIEDYDWNGATLSVRYTDGNKSTCRRDELYRHIKEMDFREW